jgi:ParB family chromosome partitioning protein
LLGGAPKSTPPASAAAPGTAVAAGESAGIRQVPLKQIRPCPFQPRKQFAEESLQELADSIREQGVVQPLIVRQRGAEFELIAGERRWRAAQRVGLSEVPVVVREVDDRSVLELALIENLQRENLNPLEEAQGFAQLIEQFQLTQEEAARRVGKSRVAVTNALRLLKLSPEVQEDVRAGRLTVGHAKVLLGVPSAADQKALATRIVSNGLNVRETEGLVNALQQRPIPSSPGPTKAEVPSPVQRDAHISDLETRLQERLGTKVHLRYQSGKGAIEIRYFSDPELERLLELLGVKAGE